MIASSCKLHPRTPSSARPRMDPDCACNPRLVLSFDVEEHDRIESAVGLMVEPMVKRCYRSRMIRSLRWLLDELEQRGIRATLFVLGDVARMHPTIVRRIQRGGHEIACHGWDHRKIQGLSRPAFREDVRRSLDELEQVTGEPVVGYRAPTFSIVRSTAWAIDVLVELGVVYDSSIVPVRHDRYGVPHAPRTPFVAHGPEHPILELPVATVQIFGVNLPVGGGGYFRLLPLWVTELALASITKLDGAGSMSLYFHPWELDPDGPFLPLRGLNRYRTYVGIRHNRERFGRLLARHEFVRAIDLARSLEQPDADLPAYDLAGGPGPFGHDDRYQSPSVTVC